MAESIARNLFREYTEQGAAELLKSIPKTVPKTFESTWLEFKSGYVEERDFPRIWSEIIGAFANTGGGVVVWGIGAARNPGTRVDAADNLQLVKDVEAFTTKLKVAAQSNVDPPLAGLEIRPIIANQGTTEGFVVCFIPEGGHKPYESLKAEKPFYMRFDDRCERIPLPVLRSLFNPSSKTEVSLTVEHGKWESVRNQFVTLRVRVENMGLNSIEAPCVAIECANVALNTREFDGRILPAQRVHTLMPQLLHPGMSSEVEVVFVLRDAEKDEFKVSFFQRSQSALYGAFIYDHLSKDFYDVNLVLPKCMKIALTERNTKI